MISVLIKSLVPPTGSPRGEAGEAGKNFNIDFKKIEGWAKNYLKRRGQDNVELSFVFVGSKKIRELNKNYRKIDKATSILAFPQGQALYPEGNLLLGDIVICPVEAEKKNLSVKFLIEHGIRNLLSEIPTAKNLRD